METRRMTAGLLAAAGVTLALAGCTSLFQTSENAGIDEPCGGGSGGGSGFLSCVEDWTLSEHCDENTVDAALETIETRFEGTQMAPYADANWLTDEVDYSGYDSCAVLSWMLVPFETAEGERLVALAVFTGGEYRLANDLNIVTKEAPEVTLIDEVTIEASWSTGESTTIEFSEEQLGVFDVEGTWPGAPSD